MRNYFEQGFEEGTTDYFYSRDRLGSVREVVGSNGITIASRLSYGPWGALTESGSGALSDFGLTGHYYDRPTGLGLTWFRAYDPKMARWLSYDPIGLAGGLNLYGYVRNDPTNANDPLGLEAEECSKKRDECNKAFNDCYLRCNRHSGAKKDACVTCCVTANNICEKNGSPIEPDGGCDNPIK
ncbi:MAG: RHS repeat-associated core domain-containing protein [Deltaproteobacteria bacterium]|nr:RHS repeat-associated core domain-containing protein [Deltaproteobacteria bacterium]